MGSLSAVCSEEAYLYTGLPRNTGAHGLREVMCLFGAMFGRPLLKHHSWSGDTGPRGDDELGSNKTPFSGLRDSQSLNL